MAVLYKTAQSILANKDGKKLFYPRVVLKGNVSTDQIPRRLQNTLPSPKATRKMLSTTW